MKIFVLFLFLFYFVNASVDSDVDAEVKEVASAEGPDEVTSEEAKVDTGDSSEGTRKGSSSDGLFDSLTSSGDNQVPVDLFGPDKPDLFSGLSCMVHVRICKLSGA